MYGITDTLRQNLSHCPYTQYHRLLEMSTSLGTYRNHYTIIIYNKNQNVQYVLSLE